MKSGVNARAPICNQRIASRDFFRRSAQVRSHVYVNVQDSNKLIAFNCLFFMHLALLLSHAIFDFTSKLSYITADVSKTNLTVFS